MILLSFSLTYQIKSNATSDNQGFLTKTDLFVFETFVFCLFVFLTLTISFLGRRFDVKGDERDWWSKETLAAFERKTACLKRQYSNFTMNGDRVRGIIWITCFQKIKHLQ